jgi:hypothetical protein
LSEPVKWPLHAKVRNSFFLTLDFFSILIMLPDYRVVIPVKE